MKKILFGFLTLASISAFADQLTLKNPSIGMMVKPSDQELVIRLDDSSAPVANGVSEKSVILKFKDKEDAKRIIELISNFID